MSTLYTDSVHYNCKKARFSSNLKKKKKLLIFSIQAQIRGFFSQSGGLDLDCHVFEYLIMFLLYFTVIITQNYQIFLGFFFFRVIGEHCTGLIDIK